MTAVGTSAATMSASILSTLGDGSATRSSGAGPSPDGGFEALFSRTIEADDSSALAGGRAETAPGLPDRRAGIDRQRDAVADDRQVTRVDDSADRSADRAADRAADPADRAARAETTDQLGAADRPPRSRTDSDSNDPATVALPLVIVAPLVVQAPTSVPSVAPSVVPASDTAVSTIDAATAQPDNALPTVASIVPGAPGTPGAPAGTPTDPVVATSVPSTGADDVPLPVESLAAAAHEQAVTSLDAAVQPLSVDATAWQQSSAAATVESVDASPAAVMSSSARPSSPVAPVADPAVSAVSAVEPPTSTLAPPTFASAAAQAVGVADALPDDALAAGGIETARSAASTVTTAVDGPSTTTPAGSGPGSAMGTTAPGAGSASGTANPTDPRATTTATPERVTELLRMRDRAALGGVVGGAMSVDLSDEGLGPLTLHALQSASGVHLTIEAADQATRDLLTSQGRALRNELESGGTALGSLDIQHSGPGSSGERGAGTPSGRVDRAGATRSSLSSSATPTLATVRPRPTPSGDGVDLLI
ncbi:MAG: flagellar hook-length control protein FliK [Actinomycetota bacterium]